MKDFNIVIGSRISIHINRTITEHDKMMQKTAAFAEKETSSEKCVIMLKIIKDLLSNYEL